MRDDWLPIIGSKTTPPRFAELLQQPAVEGNGLLGGVNLVARAVVVAKQLCGAVERRPCKLHLREVFPGLHLVPADEAA